VPYFQTRYSVVCVDVTLCKKVGGRVVVVITWRHTPRSARCNESLSDLLGTSRTKALKCLLLNATERVQCGLCVVGKV
jgi:hypothetical protein